MRSLCNTRTLDFRTLSYNVQIKYSWYVRRKFVIFSDKHLSAWSCLKLDPPEACTVATFWTTELWRSVLPDAEIRPRWPSCCPGRTLERSTKSWRRTSHNGQWRFAFEIVPFDLNNLSQVFSVTNQVFSKNKTLGKMIKDTKLKQTQVWLFQPGKISRRLTAGLFELIVIL